MSRTERSPAFDRYVAACDYPGVIDPPAVTAALARYLSALGVTRQIRQLPVNWDLATEAPLRRSIDLILDDFSKRTGRPQAAGDAGAARVAQAALRRISA